MADNPFGQSTGGGNNTTYGGIGGGQSPTATPQTGGGPSGANTGAGGEYNTTGPGGAAAFPYADAVARAEAMLASIPIPQARHDGAVKAADAAQARYQELFIKEHWKIEDAWANAQLRLAEVAGQIAAAAKVEVRPDSGGTQGQGAPTVTDADRAKALNQYREGIDQGQQVRQDIVSNPINDPNARNTFTPVETRDVKAALTRAPDEVIAERVRLGEKPIAVTATAKGQTQVTDAQAAGVIDTERLTPAQRLQAAQQTATTVQGTGLDTSETSQSRAVGDQAIKDLQETAAGRGAGQLAAEQRAKAQLGQVASAAQGLARTARGADRKAALVAAQGQVAEAGARTVSELAAKEAEGRQAAQVAVGTQALQTRATDLAVAAKKADLEAQRNQLQAQLDAARARGDADAENQVRAKMADLDQQVQALNAQSANAAKEAAAGRSTAVSVTNAGAKNTAAESAAERQTRVSQQNALSQTGNNQQQADRELLAATGNANRGTDTSKFNVGTSQQAQEFNAGQKNTTATGNADRFVGTQTANNQQGLAANVAGSQQDIAQADLRLRAQKAIEDSAKGLLDENERQNQIAIAREQLAIAKQRNDREGEKDWFDKLSALVTGAGKLAAGIGTLTSDPRAKENVEQVTPKDVEALRKAMRDSMSLYTYKPGRGEPEGPQVSPMADAVAATKLGKALTRQGPDGLLKLDLGRATSVLAAFNVGEKKRGAA